MEMKFVEFPADPQVEGTFRRGYVHGVAAVANALKANPSLTVEDLMQWASPRGAGDTWRKHQPIDRMIQPPAITG
ncbi:hypothetical protein [Komagataeibacter oboediens]|nr:hypothetical protein [Komagataeibacter oboediens]